MHKFERLLKNSKIFFLAGERCMEFRNIEDNKVEVLSIQAIVNYSLSFELQLKYILMKEGRFKPIHDTEKLFKLLNEEHQKEVVSHFPELDFPEEVLKENNMGFWRFLKNESDAFVKWRYQHEFDDIYSNIDFLRKLTMTVNYISMKYYPLK